MLSSEDSYEKLIKKTVPNKLNIICPTSVCSRRLHRIAHSTYSTSSLCKCIRTYSIVSLIITIDKIDKYPIPITPRQGSCSLAHTVDEYIKVITIVNWSIVRYLLPSYGYYHYKIDVVPSASIVTAIP